VTPLQWHLYVVDLEPRVGTKPGKQRPVLAIQPSEFGEAGLGSTVIIPITTRIIDGDAFPLRVRIAKGTTALKESSELLIDQILAWDNTLFRREIGPIPQALRARVKDALREFLDL
jgi:mRNA interferase MazF